MTTTTPTKQLPDPKQSAGIGSTLVARVKGLGGPVVGLIVMIVAMSFLSPFFLTTRNLSNILSQISDHRDHGGGRHSGHPDRRHRPVGRGEPGVDHDVQRLAVPGRSGCRGCVAMVLGLLLGMVVGLVNGLLTDYGKVQAFVATLATMSVCAGFRAVHHQRQHHQRIPDLVRQPDRQHLRGHPAAGHPAGRRLRGHRSLAAATGRPAARCTPSAETRRPPGCPDFR